MKKGLLLTVSLAVVTAVLSLVVFASAPDTVKTEIADTAENNKVITVADCSASQLSEQKVLEARFLNMLNHSFVYDSSFDTVEAIVNDSVIALLDMRDSEDDSYISQAVVSEYVYNMYGIEIEDYSEINADFPQKEGYVYILPRGYEIYSHKIASVERNEDGSYTVKTNVTISTHFGQAFTDVCETLFVENTASDFGYNIVFSNIGISAAAM